MLSNFEYGLMYKPIPYKNPIYLFKNIYFLKKSPKMLGLS